MFFGQWGILRTHCEKREKGRSHAAILLAKKFLRRIAASFHIRTFRVEYFTAKLVGKPIAI